MGVSLSQPVGILGCDGSRDIRDRPPSTGQDRSLTTIHADDLQPGDVVDYHGQPHQVTHVDRRDGWAWPVAYDDAGWAMALGHELVAVLRAA